MKRVSFRVTYPTATAHPLHRELMSRDGVSRAKLLMWGPMGTVTSLLWFDTDRGTVETLLQAIDSLTRVTMADAGEGTYAFVDQARYEFGESVLDLVAGADVVFVPPITFADSGAVWFTAVGDTTLLSTFYDRLEDALGATIETVREYRGPAESATLTDRQRAALEAATSLGYYDVPRRSSVTEVAQELECARSTAGELLRKAEAAVITRFLAMGESRQ